MLDREIVKRVKRALNLPSRKGDRSMLLKRRYAYGEVHFIIAISHISQPSSQALWIKGTILKGKITHLFYMSLNTTNLV